MKMDLDLQFGGKKNKNNICTCFICRNTSFIVKISQFWHTTLTEFIHIQENVNDADKYMLVELLISYKSIMPHKLRKYI